MFNTDVYLTATSQVTWLTAAIAFVFSCLALYALRPVADRLGLVDLPDHDRKQHQGRVPLIGGIAVFIGITSTLLIPEVDNPEHFHIYISVLFIMGVWDDLKSLSVRSRIMVQFVVALFVCLLDNHLLTYLGDIFGFGQIGTNIFAIPLTVLAIVTAINAFNMIDGIDGLAASIAIVSFASLGVIFYEKELWLSFQVCVGFVAALIPFLLCNLEIWPFKRKAFLGDAGSIVIGFAIVWLLIDGSQPEDRAFPEIKAFYPVTAMWIVGLPLFDLMSVCIRRMKSGLSPVSGDRNHIHHVILDHGISHKNCLIICVLLELLLSLVGLAFDFLNMEVASFLSFWLALIGYHIILSRFSSMKKPGNT